ncbi:NAD-dependent epimerase/dehydratase family protein [Caldibacillus debilis]|jgi:UDP-glucose 4-epimerase|uniref:Nucleoside-diphosphate-sugar epimerase n=1 Tax=Caldibacillus debilis GB1 TaxID=1339248 RepID=A0A420VJZ3_9BACI|nr:NAD-dependent epimerase/dehydratase family protein [Caldibacillus debilis]OUM83503.1 MAG: NAD-dependent dehydratase [Caldibacillus debilis]RKO63937.1 Nucleoside-diphosphate-sugar epimerase [Caldibacillus debilis GB1]
MMAKKILITGGAGFIGSHLTEHLLKQGHAVDVVDDLSNGKPDFLNEVRDHPRFQFYRGSVLDGKLMEELIRKNDVIYHLAAVLGVKNTVRDPLKVIEGNIDGTRIIMELAHRQQKKVIFASTSEVYGKNPNLPYHEHSDRLLGDPSVHRWCYATAKALDEHICFAYANKGLPVTVIRLFNVYGPRQIFSDYGMVVPVFISKALNDEPLPVHGDGSQIRCFAYVSDIVRGLELAMAKEADHHAFNLGSSDQVTILELAGRIKTLTGSRSTVEFIPYAEAYGPGFEDIPVRIPSLEKAKRLLHYVPQVSLDDGLKETVEWYKAFLET